MRNIFLLCTVFGLFACKGTKHAATTARVSQPTANAICIDVDTGKGITRDYVITYYSADSAETWSRTIVGGRYGNTVTDILVSTDGSLYVLGWFSDTLTIDGKQLVSQGGSDVFFARFATDGACLWATRYGSTGSDASTFIIAGSTRPTYSIKVYVGVSSYSCFPSVCQDSGTAALQPMFYVLFKQPTFSAETGELY